MDTQTEIAAKEFAVRVITALGGTAEVARLCEVSPAAVSQWKENGISKPRLMFLRLARPEVFKGLDAEDGRPQPDVEPGASGNPAPTH